MGWVGLELRPGTYRLAHFHRVSMPAVGWRRCVGLVSLEFEDEECQEQVVFNAVSR